MSAEFLQTLLEAATLAPSGDNVQPWRFAVDRDGAAIRVNVDEARDLSPLNAGQRMSRIACGAAVENIVHTAAHNDCAVDVIYGHSSARIELKEWVQSGTAGLIPKVIRDRHANRRLYNGRALSLQERARLDASELSETGVTVAWITGCHDLEGVVRDISRADAQMFGMPDFLRGFLENVRFDLPPSAVAEEGLSLGSLEVSPWKQWVMPFLRRMPKFFLKSLLVKLSFQGHAARLLRSASGVLLITATEDSTQRDWLVGRVMQRAWLLLTELGYQVQPMMSIPVILGANRLGECDLPSLSAIPSPPAAILRFGFGPAASTRVGRTRKYALQRQRSVAAGVQPYSEDYQQ